MITNYLISYALSICALLIVYLSINKFIKLWVSLILNIIWTTFLVIFISINYNRIPKNIIEYKVPNKTETLLQSLPLNEENVLAVMYYFDVKYPEEVTTQSVIETGYYLSYNTVKRNNILGLLHSSNITNSNPLGYYEYEYWYECILDYKNKIEYKLKEGENYYDFLKRIGYAEDPKYIQKVKHLQKKLFN